MCSISRRVEPGLRGGKTCLSFFSQNLQNGKGTHLEFSDYRFVVGLEDRDFSKNGLKRVR